MLKTQISQYKWLFGLHLCKKILLITDNLSKTLQSKLYLLLKVKKLSGLPLQH